MSEIFYTDSASFQVFEVTNKATFNNITVSGSLFFSGSYSLPFAICKMPFLNTEGQTYNSGLANEMLVDPTFNINSGEFATGSRASGLVFDKDGYYNINVFITLVFESHPNDIVDIVIHNYNSGLPLASKTQVISNNSSLYYTVDISGILAFIEKNNYIYVTVKTSTTKFDVLSTTSDESFLTVMQVR